MNRVIRLAILDYDLTLVNNIFDFYLSFRNALKEYAGIDLSYEAFHDMLVKDKLVDIVPRNLQWSVWRSMRRQICKHHYSYLNKGAEYFLYMTSLMNIRKVIVTGRECHEQYIWSELRRLGVDQYVDEIYTFYHIPILNGREDELFDKSWLLSYIVDKNGYEPRETVYIGDYKQDYYSSLKAGIHFIGLSFIEERVKQLIEIGVKHVARDFYEALYHLVELAKNGLNSFS